MQKPWLQHYGNAIPETIDPSHYPNVLSLVREACGRYGDKTAFSHKGKGLSYEQVDSLSKHFAAWLQTSAGINKGDRVAVMLPNVLAFPVAMLGIMRTGAVQVNVNPMYTPRELEHQLNDAQVETLVIFAASTATLGEVADRTPVKRVVVVYPGDLEEVERDADLVDERLPQMVNFIDALQQGSLLDYQTVDIAAEDLLFLQYTGGTTGLSKGAMLSHGNLVANILQYQAFAGDMIDHGNETVITAIPMYHIFALMVNTLSYFRFGATNVLISNPRDMPGFVKEWSNWKVTVFTGVNTLYNGLLLTPGFEELDFSELKICIGGGAAVHAAVSERWQSVTGQPICEGYGLSETSPVLTLNPLPVKSFRGSIGIPIPSTELIMLDEAGEQAGAGEAGELCARGPQIMQGYWQQPQATAEVMTDDGFFRTGDIATMDDDGFFRIVDRKKDMILVSGFNVYPNEIEAVVAQMPEVAECACVGIADDKTGEAVQLYAVRLDNALKEQAVIDYCRDNLTAYKVPKSVVFIDEIPKSSVGKILRRELRDSDS